MKQLSNRNHSISGSVGSSRTHENRHFKAIRSIDSDSFLSLLPVSRSCRSRTAFRRAERSVGGEPVCWMCSPCLASLGFLGAVAPSSFLQSQNIVMPLQTDSEMIIPRHNCHLLLLPQASLLTPSRVCLALHRRARHWCERTGCMSGRGSSTRCAARASSRASSSSSTTSSYVLGWGVKKDHVGEKLVRSWVMLEQHE